MQSPLTATRFVRTAIAGVAIFFFSTTTLRAQDEAALKKLGDAWQPTVQPILKQFCFECHSGDVTEAEVDLGDFKSLADVRRDTKTWLRVRVMLDTNQMPPKDSKQPTDAQKKTLRDWVRSMLTIEAQKLAGDPGPVVLRRLNNDEYNYTVRDLTGVDSLNPTREFPVDGAAGEGFTNAGTAQAMSPSLVQKYLDAAKEVARHAVLTPNGIEFSQHVTRRDWTDERVKAIQDFYKRFTVIKDVFVNVGGAGRVDNQGGTIPFAAYLTATLEERDALLSGAKTVAAVAADRGLNTKYLGLLWAALSAESNETSLLINELRAAWQKATPADVGKLVAMITARQQVLFRYNVIGHIGREGQPRTWMAPASPLAPRRDFSVKLPEGPSEDISVFLTASTAGNGRDGDFAVWENPRLVTPDGPDIPLRDLAGLKRRIRQLQQEALAKTTTYLAAASEFAATPDPTAALAGQLATKHKLDSDAFNAWLNYLALGDAGPVSVGGHIRTKHNHATYGFVKGWGVPATPIVLANSSDNQVRIPGISKPHSVVVHPSPTLFVATGWQSPISGLVKVEARIADAHPECGNGQEWFLQHRTNRKVGNLWKGSFPTGRSAAMTPKTISVRKGELVTFLVGPRDGSHACDLTEVSLTITEVTGKKRVWDLAKDVSPDIQKSNPRADSHGHDRVWHFYQGPMKSINQEASEFVSVPAGSLLSKWQQEKDAANKAVLARQVQVLATGDRPKDANSPDGVLWAQLNNLAVTSHNLAALLKDVEADERFGRHPLGHKMRVADLIVHAPAVVEFRIPAKLAAGRTFVAAGRLDAKDGRNGSVRMEASLSRIEPPAIGLASPVLVNDGSAARKRIEAAFNDFRVLFPPHVCYNRIVPVDEVVTLTLFYRQDDALQRLMLSDAEVDELNRLWDNLFFVTREPLRFEVAFEQIREFATQDRPDLVKVWDPLKPGVVARANAFRKRLVQTEPVHVKAVVDFAGRAWRRDLNDGEVASIHGLYEQLREAEIPHEDAVRLTIARVLTSPAFLYRREVQPSSERAASVTGEELAARLSYFLWSSTPDKELRRAAAMRYTVDGRPTSAMLALDDTLTRQTHRMLRDPKTRRLAIQFACQWLHLRNFDQNDDKNEALYPEFSQLRGAMYEETVRFFEDMFRNDGSVLDLLNADHTFLNASLAKHYGIEGVSGEDWRRVDGVRAKGRGGILGLATLLASQSGASRTSPILRGNWISETLLGEKLPKPPANVPQLPEQVPEGLTARQLIERHSSVPACAKCHARIDPYGFALEQYDAIGRLRPKPVDTKTKLVDGSEIEGIKGLRDYLATRRRDDVLRQFCRKLLGFALGREVQLSDEPLLDTMLGRLKENEYRFAVAVETIVLSPQFRKIRGATQLADAAE